MFKCCCGFTLIELVAVLVILGLLALLILPRVSAFTETAGIRTDLANIRTLNKTTLMYAVSDPAISLNDIFPGSSSDADKIQKLVDANFINETVEPVVEGASFSWEDSLQKWVYSSFELGLGIGGSYYFGSDSTFDNLRKVGDSWVYMEDGLFSDGGDHRIFFSNNLEEYTLRVLATMLPGGSNREGYGLFFETSLDKDDYRRDSGYILQYDRGYAGGEIIIRERKNGRENTVPLLRLKPEEYVEGFTDTWWEQTHEIRLDIQQSQNEGKKKLDAWIGGVQMVDGWEFESHLEPENNFTGFRTWRSPDKPETSTTFHELHIE